MPHRPAPAQSFTCQAVLFDLDGVLVDSSRVVERCWRRWAEDRSLAVAEVLELARGRRIVEVVRQLTPHLDAEAEATRLADLEAEDTEGLRVIPGAPELVASLPERSWAVVTSGRRQVAKTRLRFAGLPVPGAFVTADDVRSGKPHPEAYLTAARALGVDPAQCMVLEDAPAGLAAARAAGMQAIAVTTAHPPARLTPAVTHVADLRAIRATGLADGRVRLDCLVHDDTA